MVRRGGGLRRPRRVPPDPVPEVAYRRQVPSSPSARPRPPRLPASVYWRRRLFVLGLAASLVFTIAQLLGGGGDARDTEPAAQQAGAAISAAPRVTGGATTSAASGATAPTAAPTPAAPTSTAPAMPDGPCNPDDVRVAPSVAKGAAAGRDVAITLSLTTLARPACTWTVGATTTAVTVADADGPVWTTSQCARAFPAQAVVVRRDQPTAVTLVWNARRSDAGCSRRTTWVLPGDFEVAAAPLGGEPSSSAFTLAKPAPRKVVVTVPPKPSTAKPTRPTN